MPNYTATVNGGRSDAMKVTIPYTPILEQYHGLEKLSRQERLADAKRLAKNATPVVRNFGNSIERFALAYSNAYEPFLGRPGRKPLPKPSGPHIETGNQLVARLPRGRVRVLGRPELDFRFVEREVSVIRTRHASFDVPEQAARSAGRALLCDLLLANADDKTPIIGEIKVTRGQYTDKDPYSALVQALASAAHLVIPAQYGRLLHHFPRRFRADHGRVDVYVITGSYDSRLTHMKDLLEAARSLAGRLLEEESVTRYVRRIEFLDAAPAGQQLRLRTDFV